jgi:hypothetical protein
MYSTSKFVLFSTLALTLIGCGSDGQPGVGAGSGGNAGGGGSGPDSCAEVLCDDGDACTVDRCDASSGDCVYEPALTNACRTQIEVDFPARGATIQSDQSDATVVVSGTVSSEGAEIASLSLNGSIVTVGPDGSFSHPVEARVGGNTLVFSAEDSDGNLRERVQSFLWSTGYLKPTTPKEGIATSGLGVWLSQAALDDGKAPPPVDFAHILDLVLEGFDISGLINPSTVVASEAGYDVYVKAIDKGSSSVSINAIDGGLALDARINDIAADLDFDCTNAACFFLGGDSTGAVNIDYVRIQGQAIFSVRPDQTLQVTLRDVSTNVVGLDVSSDNGWTDFLLGFVRGAINDTLVGSVESLLNDALANELGPLLEQGLSQLAFQFSLDLPRLGGGEPIAVNLITDFQAVSFRGSAPKGGLLIERAGAYAGEATTPHDNLGVPNRDRCGQGGQVIVLPESAALEIGLSDDLLNQVFYAAWRAGWLEVEAGPELLGAADLSALGVTDLALTLSGLLAPTVSDCNETGTLRAHLGDLEIRGDLALNGEPISFTAYSSLAGNIALGVNSEGLQIGIEGIDEVETELTIHEDGQLEAEPLLLGLLETALVDAIEGALGGGGLGTVPLPQIDLSSGLGLPDGSATIVVMPQSLDRSDGVTVIKASL